MHVLVNCHLTPAQLEVGDVVRYYKNTGGVFKEMRVVKKENSGVYLRRPYIAADGEVGFEELYWNDSDHFLFLLLSRVDESLANLMA